MIVAIFTNRIGSIHASGFLAWLDDFLYLPEVLYCLFSSGYSSRDRVVIASTV
jgi:hypothetical protein